MYKLSQSALLHDKEVEYLAAQLLFQGPIADKLLSEGHSDLSRKPLSRWQHQEWRLWGDLKSKSMKNMPMISLKVGLKIPIYYNYNVGMFK